MSLRRDDLPYPRFSIPNKRENYLVTAIVSMKQMFFGIYKSNLLMIDLDKHNRQLCERRAFKESRLALTVHTDIDSMASSAFKRTDHKIWTISNNISKLIFFFLISRSEEFYRGKGNTKTLIKK